MSYNGSGTFNINSSGQPVVTGTVISSTAFNALTADLGTGLSTAITKDGQTVATARIPFAAGINSSLVTDATNTTTGSIITAGGVGIAKALFVGTTANIAGTTTLAGVTATSITDSGLTSGRVTFASTSGLLADAAALAWDGTSLSATKFAGALNGTVGATTPAAGAFTTLSATADAYFATSSGKVGIGTTSPSFAQGNGGLHIGGVSSPAIRLSSSTGGSGTWEIYADSSSLGGLGFYERQNSQTQMYLDEGGNLGIGTTAPGQTLHLKSETSANVQFEDTTSGTAGYVGPSANNQSDTTAQRLGIRGEAGVSFSVGAATKMTLDASGSLLLGPTSSTGLSGGDFAMKNTSSIRFRNAADNAYVSALLFTSSNGLDIGSGGSLATITFGIAGVGEVGRFDTSGNLLVGTTNTNPATTGVTGVVIGPTGGIRQSSGSGASYFAVTTTSGTHIQFYTYNSGAVTAGLISSSGSVTTYAVSSDYRLKDIAGPVIGAKDFIMALQPKQGTWKLDGSKFVGFLAHEFQEVSPSSVVGEKDAVDADGKPIMQAMQASSSEVMANLISLVQEQQAIITALTTRITALEAK